MMPASLAYNRKRIVALGGQVILALLNAGCLNDGLVFVVALQGELVVALLDVLVVALLSVLIVALLSVLGAAGRDLVVVLNNGASHAVVVVLLLRLPVPVDVSIHSAGADNGQSESESEAHIE